jgi:voltage-gated potassium channel
MDTSAPFADKGPPPAAIARQSRVLPRRRFMKLLVLLLALIVIAPIVQRYYQVRWFEELMLTAVLMWSVYSLEFDRRLLAPAGLLALPGVALMWLGAHRAEWAALGAHVCIAAFLVFVIVAILRYIFSRLEIEPDTIAGSIVVFLLMALAWAFAYRAVEVIDPGSFSLNNRSAPLAPGDFRYFSLITITTVGYGDIAPVGPIARAFAMLEAVIGQMYLVILVSWLVGMYVSRRSSEPRQDG